MKTSTFFRVLPLFIFLTFFSLNAQDKKNDIIDNYKNYTVDAREVVYLHLNKSAYIQGESIGFTAYVIDKKDKKLSKVTTNLYIIVEDDNQNVIKQKLIKVENGIASNVVRLDSNFNSGNYTFKAYTNWMRNFNEQNYFVESIKLIDPKKEKFIKTKSVQNSIDAQFLPEGGHLLNGVVNNVGVVLKDVKGYGVPNAKGTVTDQDNNLITEFEVNKLGIGKFLLLAKLEQSYKVNLSYRNKDYSFALTEKVEPIGVALSLVNHKNKAIVSLTTNKETLKLVKNKSYSLTIHNGDKIEAIDIVFNEKLEVISVFDLDKLTPGVNILTLFNENNQPVIERLFFNYNGINLITSNELTATKANDSITMKLNFKNIDVEQFNNISVSILPKETESYNRHHNLLSYTYLQPYVNGSIENAKYYFSNISEEKKLELDNLLITQGWSSYDWNRIFTPNSAMFYPFEQGITLKANITAETKSEENTYMVHAINENGPQFFDVDETGQAFTVQNVFLNEEDRIYLSKIDKKDELEPVKLYLQSFPNKIPAFQTKTNILKPKWNYKTFSGVKNRSISFLNLNETQLLDEVVVKTALARKLVRTRKLSEGRQGKVRVIDENERIQFQTLANYLNFNGFRASDSDGGKLVVRNMGLTLGGSPTIFLDDMLVMDTSLLYRFPLNNVDYIESSRVAIGNTINGSKGYIKIYTDYTVRGSRANRQSTQDYELPLAFSANKKYYIPKYGYYNDDFYKGYGTIDWKPELVTDSNGNISIKISQPEVPITLFIEGIANDGSFIFEEKSISFN